jgi:hypothetical protein
MTLHSLHRSFSTAGLRQIFTSLESFTTEGALFFKTVRESDSQDKINSEAQNKNSCTHYLQFRQSVLLEAYIFGKTFM